MDFVDRFNAQFPKHPVLQDLSVQLFTLLAKIFNGLHQLLEVQWVIMGISYLGLSMGFMEMKQCLKWWYNRDRKRRMEC